MTLRVRIPIRPRSVIRLTRLWPHARKQGHELGEKWRIGYYSRHDGLDVVFLVDRSGEYLWTVNHNFIKKHFEVVTESKERSFYGLRRRRLPRLSKKGHPIGEKAKLLRPAGLWAVP